MDVDGGGQLMTGQEALAPRTGPKPLERPATAMRTNDPCRASSSRNTDRVSSVPL